MYNKIPLKIRVIVLVILCVLGISLAVYKKNEGKNLNVKNTNAVKEQKTTIKAKNSNVTKTDEKQNQINNFTEAGYTAFNSDNYQVAIDDENKALALNDNNARAHAIKGIAICYSGLENSNYTGALAEIDRALQIDPNNGYARFNRALTLERFGHYDEALTWYDKALQVDNFVWSYYGKACIYGRKGDVDNAVKYLKIAIGMQANIKEEARNEEDFTNVRNSEAFKQLVD